MTETAAPPPTQAPSQPLFVRPTEGRMLTGVCAGIATRYDLDVTLVRIIAVVLALASGVGVAAYVAGWLLTPSTDAPAPLHRDSTAARRVSEQGRRLAGRIPAIVLIVLAGLAAAALLHIRWVGVPFGLVVVLLAVALVVGSRVGRWLLASVAALLVLALAVFGILGPHLGSRSFRVSSTQDLRTSYDYAAGRVSLDLSSLAGVTGAQHTRIRVGRGDVTVIAPTDEPVVVHAQTGLGSVTVDGQRVSGFGAAETRSLGTASTSPDRLVIDVQVGAGSVNVRSA
jgi:phage shock protein PspC (stress-responsive transcriptional regulator)